MTVTMRPWHFASRPPERLDGEPPILLVDVAEWLREELELLAFDRRVHALEDQVGHSFSIVFDGPRASVAVVAEQFALRYQRLFTRRNQASDDGWFDALLHEHASLHDRRKPLVRADHDHALDVWQWTLRLDPAASSALQIAALFHDIERLESEPDARVEQHASDYLGFKLEHAKKGARLLAPLLARLRLDRDLAARACLLVARHEQPEHDAELSTLNDADALSWFALNSPGFLSYFGLDHTEKKVRYTLGRMRSRRARALLAQVRLERTIADLLRDAGHELAHHA